MTPIATPHPKNALSLIPHTRAKCKFTDSLSYSVSLASVIRFPPIVFIFSISAELSSSAWMSSPPPMLLPLTRTLGTVRRPVLFSNAACNAGPIGWLSSSTTYGAGTMVYFTSNIFLALRE